jgi:phenylacetaldehyde dehydrogenase
MDMNTRELLTEATRRFLDARKRMLIGGEWLDAADGSLLDVHDPATGEVFDRVPAGKAADIDRAVRAARTAFEGSEWPALRPAQRERLLLKLADLIEREARSLAEIESLDNGKSVVLAQHVDMAMAADFLRYMAGWATKIEGTTHDVSIPFLPTAKFFAFTRKEPVGVVGAIIPWNYPLMMAAWKVAPALAAGNTMVLKPASATPLTAIRLGELALEAGIPPGVLNVVPGPGAEVGEAIAAHSGIDKVAFTGETATGRRIAEVAAKTLKRVSLELGGKSPNIVFADADLDAAVIGSLWAIFYSAGQSCEARSRILVQDEAYDAFASAFAEKATALTVGDPLADETKVGSLISRSHADRVREFIDIGIADGGEVLAGGPRVELNGDLDADAFVAPTVIAGVGNDARIAQEEVFGPVVTLTRFGDEAEAIQFANGVRYGLAATVWTADGGRGHRVAQRIRSGTVGINTPFVAFPGVPFGGFKDSGYGREQSIDALELYTETKAILQNTSAKPVNPLGV